MKPFQFGLIAGFVDGDSILAVSTFGRVHALPGGAPMTEMEMAVLQVPTRRVPRVLSLQPPEANDAFLGQILLQRPICGKSGHYPLDRIQNPDILNQHSPRFPAFFLNS